MTLSRKGKSLADRLRAEVSGLSGVDKEMADTLIEEVAALAQMVEDLRKQVQEDGVMIEMERGGANNRHVELVENPALTAYSKHVGRLSDIAKKVSGFAKGATGDGDDPNDLLRWNAEN